MDSSGACSTARSSGSPTAIKAPCPASAILAAGATALSRPQVSLWEHRSGRLYASHAKAGLGALGGGPLPLAGARPDRRFVPAVLALAIGHPILELLAPGQ